MGKKSTWTEERRKGQQEAIRRWQPWLHSTGPKTADGKKRSSQNAVKHALYSAPVLTYRDLLWTYRQVGIVSIPALHMIDEAMVKACEHALVHHRPASRYRLAVLRFVAVQQGKAFRRADIRYLLRDAWEKALEIDRRVKSERQDARN